MLPSHVQRIGRDMETEELRERAHPGYRSEQVRRAFSTGRRERGGAGRDREAGADRRGAYGSSVRPASYPCTSYSLQALLLFLVPIAGTVLMSRNENVIIQSQHAPNAWLVRNYQLNAELKELQSVLAGMEEQVTDVNRARRVYQEDVGQHLTRLETRWQELVGSTVQLEMACVAMQGEVSGMRERREVLRGEVTALEQAE